jgi:hypothetical protein
MTDVRPAGVLAALCLLGAASGEAQRVKPDELLAQTGDSAVFRFRRLKRCSASR